MRETGGTFLRTLKGRLQVFLPFVSTVTLAGGIDAEPLVPWRGNPVSPEIEAMYVKGLNYLVQQQASGGDWPEVGAASQPGIAGLVVLAILAHGNDPNHGPYRTALRRALNSILRSANPQNGYIGPSMYHHGFATLALAEAYGHVHDDRIGPALAQAVKLILASQTQNPQGAWRYSPESRDADTTVSGAQLVALLAARNAGIAIPDSAIERALDFFRRTQGHDGGFGYTSNEGSSPPRVAIGTLVFALAKRKESHAFKAGFRHLQQMDFSGGGHLYYYLYYAAQAYFHADMTAWKAWSEKNKQLLSSTQHPDGSWSGGGQSPVFCTAAALLSLALEYRYLPIYER